MYSNLQKLDYYLGSMNTVFLNLQIEQEIVLFSMLKYFDGIALTKILQWCAPFSV